MRLRVLVILLLVAFALTGAARPVRAQSLADAARKEAERRKTVKEAGNTITNKDLPNTPLSSTSASSGVVDAAPAPATPQSKDAADKAKAADAANKDKDKDAAKPKDQKYWGDRMKDLQTTLSRDQAFADALQVQINSLTTDFVNRDDPAQRSVIGQNKQKAIDEQARLTKAIVDDRKAIADLEEEARHAGVPPGWLR
jgi:hypothetical protein